MSGIPDPPCFHEICTHNLIRGVLPSILVQPISYLSESEPTLTFVSFFHRSFLIIKAVFIRFSSFGLLINSFMATTTKSGENSKEE